MPAGAAAHTGNLGPGLPLSEVCLLKACLLQSPSHEYGLLFWGVGDGWEGGSLMEGVYWIAFLYERDLEAITD